MTEIRHYDTKVTPEGRVLVPADVRRFLAVSAGDRVRFIVDGSEVRLVSARSLAEDLWAANADASGDTREASAAADVRWSRDVDARLSLEKDARTRAAVAVDPRSETQVATDLLASLALDER